MNSPSADLSKLRIDRDSPPSGLTRALWRNLILMGIALALVITVAAILWRGGAIPVEAVVVNVAGDGAVAGSAGTSVTANGYVVARTRASVSAKVPGRLAHLSVSEGSFVRVGAIIGRLSNEDFQAQVAEADARVSSSKADLLEADATQAQLEREARRLRDIRTQNEQLVSAQDVEAAETRAATAVARTRAAAARVQAAEAGRRYASAILENTFIRAPFTGTVLRKEAEVGEVVAPSVGGGLTRGAVVTMADLSTLEVEVDVNEAYIARIQSEQEARITLDAYPDTSFRGKVRQVVPTADRQRATVQVKVSITDRDPRILPEMGARVDFMEPEKPASALQEKAAPRLRVPAAAVRDQGGQTVVWLVRDQRLQLRPVDAGPVSAGFREIRSGLTGGELILLSGTDEPKAGLRVKVSTAASQR